MTEKLEQIINFYPAYDRRNPDLNLDYGICSVRMIWILKGQLGAVQFVVSTGWHLPHVIAELRRKKWPSLDVPPRDLGYHSKFPLYEGQTVMDENCPYTNGICYYDGSTLNAEPVFDILVREGHEAVWNRLEECYNECFEKFQNENFVENIKSVKPKRYRNLIIRKGS